MMIDSCMNDITLKYSAENFKKFINCIVCFDILNNPMECSLCDSLVCEECYNILTIAGKKCFGKCIGNYKKANKYIRDIISDAIIKCYNCNSSLSYITYFSASHLSRCFNEKIKKINLVNIILNKEETINKLQEEINPLLRTKKFFNINFNPKLLKLSNEKLKELLMSFNLSIDQKMEIYHAVTQGNLELFKKQILDKRYPILEEISYKDYYWTPLHYAMHFGQLEIIYFIFDLLKEENLLELALRIQSNDGRCPFLCLLKSNYLSSNAKEEILAKLLTKYIFNISKEVKKECIDRGYEKTLKKYAKM